MPNYPASLDSAIHPGPGTFRDDPGFELDVLVSELMDRTVALETKLGISASTAAAGTVLRGTSAGASAFGALQVGDLAAGIVARKNRVINGSFNIWRQTTSFTASADNGYTVDRWKLLGSVATAGAYGVIQDGTTLPAASSRYAASVYAQAGGVNSKFGLFTLLESRDIYDLRGQPVSLQFKYRSTSGISDLRGAIVQWTGTADVAGADPIANWNVSGTPPSLSGSWTYVGQTGNLAPTTSYQTATLVNQTVSGSAVNLGVFIWSEDVTTVNGDSFNVSDVQLERGAAVTDVERRPVAEEQVFCWRYGLRLAGTGSNGLVVMATGLAIATNSARLFVPFPVQMRTSPSYTRDTVSQFAILNSSAGYAGGTLGSLDLQAASPVGATLNAVSAGGLAVGDATMLVDAAPGAPGAFIDFVAEL